MWTCNVATGTLQGKTAESPRRLCVKFFAGPFESILHGEDGGKPMYLVCHVLKFVGCLSLMNSILSVREHIGHPGQG